MNMYDTTKRVRIVFDELLVGENLEGLKLLDAGCGTGWFSKRACERGADVTSLDIGENLLEQVAKKCNSTRVVGDVCNLQFPSNNFDIVISSDVIEHTVNPRKALSELARVVKPNGILVITVPNKVWHFAITIANKLKLRPYQGFENWVGWGQLRDWVKEEGLVLEEMYGFHIVPFITPVLYPLIDFFDGWGKSLGPLMLNIAIKAKK
jgi:2-polyprenyl-3-methyl-5-hydroxy-6-metoxy-1,4-benzoquinol methylase